MLLGLLPKDQDEERNKGTNSDVGLVARTTVVWYNRDGCKARQGRSVRPQHQIFSFFLLLLLFLNALLSDKYFAAKALAGCNPELFKIGISDLP